MQFQLNDVRDFIPFEVPVFWFKRFEFIFVGNI